MNIDIHYLITPFLAWLIAGTTKFLINSIKSKKLAFELIGYGHWPSNHSAIVSSVVTLIALKEGLEDPAFGVALTLAFVVIMDASSLRRQIGRQAAAINRLYALDLSTSIEKQNHLILRERVGHNYIEILSGLIVGILVAVIIWVGGK